MSNYFFGEFQFISLWIQENPLWIRGLLLEANSLVFVPSRDHRVYFLQASSTSVGINALTYLGLMANRRDNDHHNNDGGDDVNNLVFTRAEFLNFRDENHQFCEKSKEIIGEIK